ncbi:hypothetical protein, partial [Escherichia coli]|uniref:hypothetical protein n=1 Tax=Escherichia coli TaxID=562 RepID=UPI0032E3AD7F
MPWVMDLCGRQAWATEAIAALRAGNAALEPVDAPATGSAAGIIICAVDSQELLAALRAAEYIHTRVMVIGPPDGTLRPWPVLEAGASE